MKLESSFKKFLEDTVNLNRTRYDTAKAGIETITGILRSNQLFGDKFINTSPQGSFRQGTIIKPVDSDQDFDVDLLFEMELVAGWEPKDYLKHLADQFRALERYKEKIDTRGKTRCVTIDYESDFHIDIVPAIRTAGGHVIMNKVSNQFEPTDGEGYALWFEEKNAITGNKHLTKAVRLLKYVRDVTGEFEAKSVVLTTLLGNQVLATDSQADCYPDLPTTFLTLISRLDKYLQSNPSLPVIVNPVLPSENFNRHWDPKKYETFKKRVHFYAEIAQDAFNERDEVASTEKWQQIFGEKFPKSERITSLSVEPLENLFAMGLHLGDTSHKQELSDPSLGITDPGSYPFSIKIKAGLYFGRNYDRVVNRRYISNFLSGSKHPPNHWLRYEVIPAIDPSLHIYWQIVNTGEQAASVAGGLRGKIVIGGQEQWERSLYAGIHWIECFVVDPQTKVCVSRSGPFYVGFDN